MTSTIDLPIPDFFHLQLNANDTWKIPASPSRASVQGLWAQTAFKIHYEITKKGKEENKLEHKVSG